MTLVAHYPLDEDSGTTANDVAGTNDGTNNGATVGATGILGTTCYDFDGTDDYVDLGFSSLSIPASWSFWAYPHDATTDKYAIVNWANTGADMWINFRSDGFIDFVVDPATDSLADSVSYSANEWVHVVGTIDGTDIKLYKNGALGQSGTGGSGSLDSGHNYYVGGITGQSQDMDGLIDEVRVYDHALTPQEVQYLYEVTQRASYTTSVVTS